MVIRLRITIYDEKVIQKFNLASNIDYSYLLLRILMHANDKPCDLYDEC